MKLPSKQWLIGSGIAIAAAMGIVSDFAGSLTFSRDTVAFLASTKIALLYPTFGFLLLGAIPWYLYLRTKKPSPDLFFTSEVANGGQFYERLERLISEAQSQLVVVGLEEGWIFPLVISVAQARLRKVNIWVVYYRDYHARYRLLEYLGCGLIHAPSPGDRPFIGVFKDPEKHLAARALVRTDRREDSLYARYYYGPVDSAIIGAAYAHLRGRFPSLSTASGTFTPEICQVTEAVMVEAVRKVKAYENAKIEFEEVRLADVFPVSKWVIKYKINQVQALMRHYETHGLAFFAPIGIILQNKAISLILPPIIEIHNDRMYVAEGHSRIYSMLKAGKDRAKVIVIRGVKVPLPLPPCQWKHVGMADEKHEARNPEMARYIETATHEGVWDS